MSSKTCEVVKVHSFTDFITTANGQLSLGTCNFVAKQITNSDMFRKPALNSDLKSVTTNKCSTNNICQEKIIPLQKN